MPCDEGRKSWLYRRNCNGKEVVCPHCDQRVCEYHRHTNDGSVGGHSGCKGPQCEIEGIYRHNCGGSVAPCPGCGKGFCEYHRQQTCSGLIPLSGGTKVRGGHTCTEFCETSAHYRHNCSGRIAKCADCGYKFCAYHIGQAGNAFTDLVGGHVCEGHTAGGAAANLAGQAAHVVAGSAAAVALTGATGGLALAGAAAGGALTGIAAKTAAEGTGLCSTTTVFKHMCSGACAPCPHCQDSYCRYHLEPVDRASVPKGGHVCRAVTAHASAANAAAWAAEAGVIVAGVAGKGALKVGAVACQAVQHGSKMQAAMGMFLEKHRSDQGDNGALAAYVASIAAAGVGVAVLVVSGGAAEPGARAIMASTALISAGTAGAGTAYEGALHENFQWSTWVCDVGVAGGTALITFGVAHEVGQHVGLALRDATTLSVAQIRACGAASGAIVGAGIHVGKALVVRRCRGEPAEPFMLFMEGVAGAVAGASAGYLGARAVPMEERGWQDQGLQRMQCQEADCRVTVHASEDPITAADVKEVLQLTKDSNTLVLSGTHGDEVTGQCVVDALAKAPSEAGDYAEHLFFMQDVDTVEALGLEGNVQVCDMANYFGGVQDGVPDMQAAVDQLAGMLRAGKFDNVVTGFCHGQFSELIKAGLDKYNIHLWLQEQKVAAGVAAAAAVSQEAARGGC